MAIPKVVAYVRINFCCTEVLVREKSGTTPSGAGMAPTISVEGIMHETGTAEGPHEVERKGQRIKKRRRILRGLFCSLPWTGPGKGYHASPDSPSVSLATSQCPAFHLDQILRFSAIGRIA